jgi:AAA+ superfamily predicted ATPase
MTFETDLDTALRARFSLIVVVSREEARLIETLRRVCDQSQRACLAWDVAEGFQSIYGETGALPAARDPLTALEQIDQAEGQALYLLKDFHEVWDNPQIKRKLRSLSQRLRATRKSILVSAPTRKLPGELSDEAVLLELPNPNAAELETVLDRLTGPGVRVDLTSLGREKLIQAALGLTAAQAGRVFARAIVSHGGLDERSIDLVTDEKKQVIRESEALEFYPAREAPDDVGGLDVLKEWLRLRERAFTHEAREYGLPAPKGIALIGIPGTGKSLTAKMIGGLWRLPLLRLDVGALFGSLVGESEERVRRALRIAEAVAPCLVWIDEMEKALGQGDLDGGTSSRVFGAILTWMQEKTAPCFVVATANDITRLPPELLRKGRFDEIFFLDLPTQEEREEILAVHIRKRGRIPQDYDLRRLGRESAGYVGSEIEQAVIDAMYVGFDAGREFDSADVEAALKRQVPLSVSQREVVNALRLWLKQGRARSASYQAAQEAEQRFVPVQ